MHLWKIVGIVVISLVSVGVYFVTATNEISSQIILNTGKTVINQDISYPDGTPLVTSMIITVPVGAETGPHTHEYPMFGYVMEGEISVDQGEYGIKTFLKGDALIEAVNYTHNGWNSGDIPAKVLVVIMGED